MQQVAGAGLSLGVPMLVARSVAVWLLILALAIANGALREMMLLDALPRSSAFIASGAILITCVFVASFFTIRWLGRLTAVRRVLIGVLWLALTLAFEFGFGMLMRDQSLEAMLEGYRFEDGNIWPLVLVAVAVAPLLAAYTRGLLTRKSAVAL